MSKEFLLRGSLYTSNKKNALAESPVPNNCVGEQIGSDQESGGSGKQMSRGSSDFQKALGGERGS